MAAFQSDALFPPITEADVALSVLIGFVRNDHKWRKAAMTGFAVDGNGIGAERLYRCPITFVRASVAAGLLENRDIQRAALIDPLD